MPTSLIFESMHGKKKVLFWGKIFHKFTRFAVPEFENQFFSDWFVCACMCLSVISITQKLQIWYSACITYVDITRNFL